MASWRKLGHELDRRAEKQGTGLGIGERVESGDCGWRSGAEVRVLDRRSTEVRLEKALNAKSMALILD